MIQMLLADARAALPGSRVVVFDVGANNGLWAAKEWPQVAAELREAGTRFDLFIIEPQPQFAKQLQALADHYNFTFVRAAAWKQETTLDFDTMPSAGTGSMSATISRGASLKGFVRTAVPAIDLAALLRVQLPEDGRTLSYLKLDVEGAEFELLPWLLLQGALCRVGYLLVEWHLLIVSGPTSVSPHSACATPYSPFSSTGAGRHRAPCQWTASQPTTTPYPCQAYWSLRSHTAYVTVVGRAPGPTA